jgi:hypothetical protein
LVLEPSIGFEFACEFAQMLADTRATADTEYVSYLSLRETAVVAQHA